MKNKIAAFAIFLALSLTATGAFAANYSVNANQNWSAFSPAPTPSDTVTIAGGVTLTVDVSNAIAGAVTVGNSTAGIAKLVLSSGSRLNILSTGGQSGTLTIGTAVSSSLSTVDLSLGGTLQADQITNAGTFAAANTLSTGNGTVILTGSNGTLPSNGSGFNIFNVLTISGKTTLQQQTSIASLNLGNGGSSGTLDLNGNTCSVSQSFAVTGGNSNVVKNSSGTACNFACTLNAGTTTYSGAIQGNLTLIKDGFGTLILSGGASNTFTQGTLIQGGNIQLGGNNSLSNGALTLGGNGNAGTLDLNGFDQTVQALTIGGSAGLGSVVTNSSGNGTLKINGGNGGYTGSFTGSGLSLNFNPGAGSTFTIDSPSSSNIYTGNTSISSGTLLLNKANLLSSSSLVFVQSNAALDLNGKSTAVGGISGPSNSTIKSLSGSAATLTVGTAGIATSTFNGPILGPNLTLAIDNGQEVTLNSNSNSFGALNIEYGSVKVGSAAAIPTGIPVTLGLVDLGGTLDLNGHDVTIGTLQSNGGLFLTNAIIDSAAADVQSAKTLTTQIVGGPFEYYGQSTAKLSVTGGGTLLLSKSDSFTILNVQNGTVQCGDDNIFTDTDSVLTLGTGGNSGVFDLAGHNQSVNMIATSGSGGLNNKFDNSNAAAPVTLTIQNSLEDTPFSFDGSFTTSPLSVNISIPASSTFTFSGAGSNTGTTLDSGQLNGTGTLTALTASSGTIVSPGVSGAIGTLSCSSADLSGATLQIRIQGTSSYDVLHCNTGQLTLDANSNLILDVSGFPSTPIAPITLPIATFGTLAGDFTLPGQLTVINNTSGFGFSLDYSDPTQLGVVVSTLTSTLTSISPDSGVLNGASFPLVVTGTNFVAGSTVRWNGSDLVTTVDSPTQLTATVPASDLTTAGKASITVFSPPPGLGETSAVTFLVYSGATTGTWIVTNTNDSGNGSLRFVMQQMRTGDSIIFDPNVFDLTNSDAQSVINVSGPLPAMVQGNVTIDAQDRRVTVNGSGALSANGFEIRSSGNKIMGLNITGFPKSGILIYGGAQNNTIGGPRSTGVGPNGQGLRISNNGSFGIEISGSGTNSNVIKGCWIGLDSAGTSSHPNLAGIIIQNGAQQNTIGGTVDGEANVISGNKFEGITITGTGTDNNVVVGNIVGASAVTVSSRDVIFGTRSSVGNGSSGVFLSKGTKDNIIGGSSDPEGNYVASNGGNGVEVRAQTSKGNTVRGNRIKNNSSGGIKLFDGSNNGIQPPTITSVIDGAASTINGSATLDGVVEIFNDSGSQGSTLLARATVTNGQWSATATVDSTQNITATLTDANGNTSEFSVFTPSGSGGGGTPGGTIGGLPTDLSSALGGLATDPATTFFGGNASSAELSALTLNQLQIRLNFAKTGVDQIKLAATLPVPDGFSFDGQVLAIDVGGVAKMVTLNSHASATGDVSAKFTKPKNGISKFSAKFIKGDFSSTLATAGLGTASANVPLNVYIVFNKTAYGANPTVPYVVAKTGKTGAVKYAK